MDQVKPNSLDEDALQCISKSPNALERNTGIKQPANTGVKNVANIGLQHPLLRDISCIERGLALHSGKSLLVLQAKALHQEAKDVGVLLYGLAGGFASAMTPM